MVIAMAGEFAAWMATDLQIDGQIVKRLRHREMCKWDE